MDPEGRLEQDPGDGQEDLMLGVCATLQAGIPLTHSDRLFQVCGENLVVDPGTLPAIKIKSQGLSR